MDFSPLWISLKTAFLATIITSIIGIFISYKMANYKGRGRGLIDGVFTLPLILPPTVIGFFLLLICGKNGFVGKIFMSFNKNIIFSWSATVIAATVVAFPMMYRTCRSAFEQIDKNMISVARTLGLSETKIFLGEFGATLMIAGNIPGKTQTMPVAIFFAVEGGDMNKAMLWVLIIVAISFIMIFLLNYWCDTQQKLIGNRGR